MAGTAWRAGQTAPSRRSVWTKSPPSRAMFGGVRAIEGLATSKSFNLDGLVELAHEDPERAEAILVRAPQLAIEPSSWGESCLQAASHLGHGRLVLRLLGLGVPLDLFAECAVGNTARAAKALHAGEDELLGVHRLPVLHFAIMSRDSAAVESLLDAGARVNSPSAALPPLHSAVACRDLSIVGRLLQAGADPDAADAFGSTALDWAVHLGEGAGLLSLIGRRDW